MGKVCLNVRVAGYWILFEPKFVELRNHSIKRCLDSSESRISRLFTGCSDPLEESLTKWILLNCISANKVSELQQLRDKMEVSRFTKKSSEITELKVCINLLKVCLREPLIVLFIVGIRSVNHQSLAFLNYLLGNDDPIVGLSFAFESQAITPYFPQIILKSYVQEHLGVLFGIETPKFREATAIIDSFLQTSSRGFYPGRESHIPKKANRIKQIRFSTGIRTNDKHSIPQPGNLK